MPTARIAPMKMADPAEPRLIGYVSADTLAQLFEISVTTVWDWTKRGVLPKPLKLGGVPRWNWSAVEKHLAGQTSAGKLPDSDDPDDPILRASRGG